MVVMTPAELRASPSLLGTAAGPDVPAAPSSYTRPFFHKQKWADFSGPREDYVHIMSFEMRSSVLFLFTLVALVMVSLSMQSWPVTPCYQGTGVIIWLAIGGLYWLVTLGVHGPEQARSWALGYLLELVFSVDNILIFKLITEASRTPIRAAKKALFCVICVRICFQFALFLGAGTWLKHVTALPYLLGLWLIYVGYTAWTHDSQDQADFDLEETSAFRLPKWLLCERLQSKYDEDRLFITSGGKTTMTMLGPVFLSLLLVDLIMEADVSLTKIEEIQNHHVAFSSSAVAAFAVPEFFYCVSCLMERYPELKLAVCVSVVYFGVELLLIDVISVNSLFVLLCIIALMLLCIVHSEVKRCSSGLWPQARKEVDEAEAEVEGKSPEA